MTRAGMFSFLLANEDEIPNGRHYVGVIAPKYTDEV